MRVVGVRSGGSSENARSLKNRGLPLLQESSSIEKHSVGCRSCITTWVGKILLLIEKR